MLLAAVTLLLIGLDGGPAASNVEAVRANYRGVAYCHGLTINVTKTLNEHPGMGPGGLTVSGRKVLLWTDNNGNLMCADRRGNK